MFYVFMIGFFDKEKTIPFGSLQASTLFTIHIYWHIQAKQAGTHAYFT